MELVILGPDLQPDKPVEGWESLIWTERYSSNGDFELISSDISGMLARLPRNSLVSLRESTVPMIADIYKITKKQNAAPQLSIKGVSFETVLNRRASVRTLPTSAARAPWTITADKESDAAYKAMRIVLGDIARLKAGVEVLAALSPAISAKDAIPQIDLTLPADYSTGTSKTYEIKASNLYKTVMELLATNHRGLKAVRPSLSSDQIAVEIYNGADLSSTVIFDARFDQFDSATYLLSDQGSTNVGYVYGPNGSQQVLKTAAVEPEGLDRRVLLVDEIGDSTVTTTDIRRTRGLVELYKYNATALFDGEVSEQVAAGYNRDYFLGDIIKLNGEYGLSELVRVAEFIRTSDSTGEKAYPAFETVVE